MKIGYQKILELMELPFLVWLIYILNERYSDTSSIVYFGTGFVRLLLDILVMGSLIVRISLIVKSLVQKREFRLSVLFFVSGTVYFLGIIPDLQLYIRFYIYANEYAPWVIILSLPILFWVLAVLAQGKRQPTHV